jgi:hypothetical protein
MMKDEKLMADKEDTLKTLSRVKEHTEATVVELESKLVSWCECGSSVHLDARQCRGASSASAHRALLSVSARVRIGRTHSYARREGARDDDGQAALSESSKAMKEEVEELKMTNVKLETAAKTAALDVADAKKETNIIALRGAEVEKEMASVQVRRVLSLRFLG